MKASFLHLADVHLGNAQYGKRERADDFAGAFYYAVDYAIHWRVDFVLIAGDLFERATLDPMTFDQALYGLEDLRRARIPVVGIAGNHDRARYGQDRAWLESMGLHGFLHYLDASTSGSIQLAPWTEDSGCGGLLEMKGIRFAGVKYLGASATPRVIEQVAAQLRALPGDPRPYTIVLLHGGLEGSVPNFRAEFTYPQLAPLRDVVDYLALGHIHKSYRMDNWVFNPGSLETWNASEVNWQRGFFHVEVDTGTEAKHRVELVEPPRRPFLRHHLDVEPCRGPEELTELTRRSVAGWAAKADAESPVVHLTLRGRLRFDRRNLDLAPIEETVREAFRPLVVQVIDQTDETAFQVQTPGEEGRLDREALELDVFRQIHANDESRVHSATGWAKLTQEMKRGALAKLSPEELAETVERELPKLQGIQPVLPEL